MLPWERKSCLHKCSQALTLMIQGTIFCAFARSWTLWLKLQRREHELCFTKEDTEAQRSNGNFRLVRAKAQTQTQIRSVSTFTALSEKNYFEERHTSCSLSPRRTTQKEMDWEPYKEKFRLNIRHSCDRRVFKFAHHDQGYSQHLSRQLFLTYKEIFYQR